MKVNKILTDYVNKEKAPRKIGRYWASDIYPITKGYLKPENFFKQEPVDLIGCQRILTGLAMEERLEKILKESNIPFEAQVKAELKIDDEITLVVKSDFNFKRGIVETKFPFSPVKNKIPRRYAYQLECQYRAFYLPVYLGILTIPFNLELIEYIPSRRRWNNIVKTLKKFHSQVKEKKVDITNQSKKRKS